METKKNVVEIRSRCPATYSMAKRARHELELLEASIKSMDGNIDDYGINADDKGMVLFNVGEDAQRWDWVTEFVVMPIAHAKISLQSYLSWLQTSVAIGA